MKEQVDVFNQERVLESRVVDFSENSSFYINCRCQNCQTLKTVRNNSVGMSNYAFVQLLHLSELDGLNYLIFDGPVSAR